MQAATKAIKAAMMAVREAVIPISNARPIYTLPRSSNPASRQPIFDWKAIEKYQELCK